jgi:hypothetical protein
MITVGPRDDQVDGIAETGTITAMQPLSSF